jgi:hypothetical protein
VRSVAEVKIVKIEEGESGVRSGNLTEERLTALTEWYALSHREKAERGLPSAASVSSLLGISPARVRAAQTDKRVLAGVRDRLDTELLYMVVEWRPQLRALLESDKEDTRLKAGRTLEELAGNLKKAGNVNVVNQNIVQDSSYSDAELLAKVEEVLGKRTEEDD